MSISLKEGQIWSYKTRDEERQSKVTILKIDALENEIRTVHVSVDGLMIKSSNAPDGLLTYIQHLPVSLKSLNDSIVELEGEKEVSLNDGYSYWLDEFLANKAGVWDICIAEVIEIIEKAQE